VRYLDVTPTKAVVLVREQDRGGGGVTPALVSVANRPLLVHALDWLAEGGVREVALVASEQIAKRAWDAVGSGSKRRARACWLYRVPGETLGEALEALTGFVEDEPFVLHLGDSLAKESLPRVLGDSIVPKVGAVFLTHRSGPALAPVVDIRSGRCAQGGNGAGVAVLGGAVLATTPAVDARPGSELNALASHLSEIGAEVEFRSAAAWWRFRDAGEAMLEGNRFALESLRGAPVNGVRSDSSIEGEVLIDPSARIESSTVRGPAVIGPGVHLDSAYVGPFTSVGPNVLIEGAEIENSIVLAGASVTHLSMRLEGSIIGPGARVFKDFRIPRAMRLHVGPGAEVAVI
jgi:glucose-1-phosphate thymidylyltransferase